MCLEAVNNICCIFWYVYFLYYVDSDNYIHGTLYLFFKLFQDLQLYIFLLNCEWTLHHILYYRSGTFVIGSKSELELKVSLINYGEPAYMAGVNITIPFPVELAKGHMDCQESNVLHELQLICNFGNPLKSGNLVCNLWYWPVHRTKLETQVPLHYAIIRCVLSKYHGDECLLPIGHQLWIINSVYISHSLRFFGRQWDCMFAVFLFWHPVHKLKNKYLFSYVIFLHRVAEGTSCLSAHWHV